MFDIVTYCSKNYEDSLALALPWWTKVGGADQVYIYTDEPLSAGILACRSEDSTVITRHCYGGNKVFKSSTDWLENVGRLPMAVLDYVNHAEDGQKFALMGTDCIFVRDVSRVYDFFEGEQCLGGLRMGHSSKQPVNAFFGIVNPKMRELIYAWEKISATYRECKIGVEPHYSAYDQISYGAVLS